MRNAWCFLWDDAAIARLKELWAEGLSASECGKRIGVSRNSVIGKIHRLGLSHQYRRPRERRPRMRTKAKPAQPIVFLSNFDHTPELPQVPPTGGYDLLDLRHGMCRYPSGDRPPFRFCGAAVEDGYPYCQEHAAICYNRHPARAAA